MLTCPSCGKEQLDAPACRDCGSPLSASFETVNPYASPTAAGDVADQRDAERRPAKQVLATRGSRLTAALLDTLITLGACLPGGLFLMLSSNAQDPEMIEIIGIGVIVTGALLCNIYQWVLMTRRGQSLGKIALGIRIVRHDNGGHAGFGRAVARRVWLNTCLGLIPFVGDFYPLIDSLFIFGSDRRCIHDLLGGTKVIGIRASEMQQRFTSSSSDAGTVAAAMQRLDHLN